MVSCNLPGRRGHSSPLGLQWWLGRAQEAGPTGDKPWQNHGDQGHSFWSCRRLGVGKFLSLKARYLVGMRFKRIGTKGKEEARSRGGSRRVRRRREQLSWS